MKLEWRAGLGMAALWLLMMGSSAAQSDRGAIAGSILDSTGAALPGASITLKGVTTGSVYKTVSSSTGGYRVNDLAIGRYDVTVEATGFKSSVQQGVDIQISTVSSLNITLQPGDVKEEVTVLADAPTLQTESSDVGTVVEDKQIHDLPLSLNSTGQSFVRSPETFIFLTPGTIGQGTNSDHGAAGIYESKISGGQNFGSEILLDGASVQRSDSGTAFDQTAPSVEALTEFKVTTSTPSAQFGHTSGGVESFTTKSGSNRYHGSAFELFRNEVLDAQSWTNDYSNALANYENRQIQAWNVANPTNQAALETIIRKPRDRQNDFGGSLGGPVRIPRLYDGHDKTFFFFAWEQYRNWRGLTNDLQTLPSAAELGGDFSALLGPGLTTGGTTPTPIMNPCNGQQVLQGQIFDPSTTQVVGGQTCRLPFPGNKLTPSSKVAQSVLKYLPAADRGGAGTGGLINDYLNPASLDHVVTTQTSFRIDEDVTQKSKLFFSYSSREQNFLNANAFDLPSPLTPGGQYYNYYFTHYLRFGWDYILSPTLLNHLTIGFNRVYTANKAPSVNGSDWPQTLGISNASGPTFPSFSFNGAQYGISYSSWGDNAYSLQIPNALVVADSISWTKGSHSFRFGFDWRTYQYSLENTGVQSPSYTFTNNETSFAPPSQTPSQINTGDPFASFLLGLPDQEQLQVSSHFSRWLQNYYAVYAQDDFKARKDLTVNLGLRWDIETPRHEATGAQSVLSLTAPNPDTSGQLGALIYGKGATGASTYFKDFGPRLGFAYAPDYLRNTVVRGAYSIYYAPLTYSDFGDNLSSGTTANPNFQNPDHFTPASSLDAGFPAYSLPSNTANPALGTFTTNPIFYVAPDYGRAGMIQNWDLEVQHQITSDLIFSVGYIGQHGTRLRSNLAQINTPNPKYNSLGAALGYQVDGSDGKGGPAILSSLGVAVPSWFTPGWGSGSGNNVIGQLLRPLPQYSTITTNCCLENLGQSTYNALQTKLERRFRNGLNLLASYTYSKTITDADSSFSTETGFNSNVFGAQNPYNLRGEKALSYQDVPHAFVVSYMYELPAGHGKRYFNHGVGSKILGGWQISGVHRYQSGAPAVINEYATSNPYSGGNYRFSLIPGQNRFGTGRWTPSNQVNANGGLLLTSVSANPLGPQYPGSANFSGGWNSSCAETAGVFSPNNTSPSPANCSAYVDPSAASLATGGGYVFGNIPPVVGWWRSPHFLNEDFSLLKRTTVREGQDILFKLDMTNAFNRHSFGGIDGSPFDSTFGVPGGGGHSVINAPRALQATLRFEF